MNERQQADAPFASTPLSPAIGRLVLTVLRAIPVVAPDDDPRPQ
jgi:hypothetical protein